LGQKQGLTRHGIRKKIRAKKPGENFLNASGLEFWIMSYLLRLGFRARDRLIGIFFHDDGVRN
jgi:hypothetical protein